MTWYYIVGELSLLLMEMEGVASDDEEARIIHRLRARAERACRADLPGVAVEALEFADGMCERSLLAGDAGRFSKQLEISSELLVFGLSAGLINEG